MHRSNRLTAMWLWGNHGFQDDEKKEEERTYKRNDEKNRGKSEEKERKRAVTRENKGVQMSGRLVSTAVACTVRVSTVRDGTAGAAAGKSSSNVPAVYPQRAGRTSYSSSKLFRVGGRMPYA